MPNHLNSSRRGLSAKTAAAASEKAFAEGELALAAGDNLTALHWFAASSRPASMQGLAGRF